MAANPTPASIAAALSAKERGAVLWMPEDGSSAYLREDRLEATCRDLRSLHLAEQQAWQWRLTPDGVVKAWRWRITPLGAQVRAILAAEKGEAP